MLTGKNPGYMLVGPLVVGEKPSDQVTDVGALCIFGIVSMRLVTECVTEGAMGADVLDRVEFLSGGRDERTAAHTFWMQLVSVHFPLDGLMV